MEGNSKLVRMFVRAAFKKIGERYPEHTWSDRSRGKDTSRLNVAIPCGPKGKDIILQAHADLQTAGYSNTLHFTSAPSEYYIRFQAPAAK